ncbi:MAG TPA: hypothetical protein VML00_01670, partial [Bacteroidota bacterium]|nr:hypothetical protein [Bacteroidota bacterium]
MPLPRFSIACFLVAAVSARTPGQSTGDIRLNRVGFYTAMPKIALVKNAGGVPFYVVARGT